MVLYEEVLNASMAHAPVAPTTSKERMQLERACKHDQVEPKWIAAIAILSKFTSINPTHTTPSEFFSKDLFYNSIDFFIEHLNDWSAFRWKK